MARPTDPIGPPPSVQAAHSGGQALARRVRWLAVRGGAAAIAGVLVLGLGGRLVMFVARQLHPGAVGRLTENGNRIGDFTLVGTLELVVFGGLLGGITAGFVWAIGKDWLLDHPLAVGLAAAALGGGSLVDAGNVDFVVLQDPAVDLVLLLGLLIVFGVALVPIDRWLDRTVPGRGPLVVAASTVAVGLVLPLSIPVVGSFFSRGFCFCDDPPVLTGTLLVVAGLAAVTWWTLDVRGAERPPRWVERTGVGAMTLAVIVGAADVALEVAEILG